MSSDTSTNPGTVNPADQAFGQGLPATVDPTSQAFGANVTKQQPGPGPLLCPPVTPSPPPLPDATLAATYAAGSLPVDQTLLVLDTKGGPFVVDGTGVGFTGEFSLVVLGSVQAASNLAVGVPSASARIHAAAGTAAPGTAPLKIPPGILLGVPEPGAVESDPSHIYWTDSLGTRHQLDNSAATLASSYDAGSVAADQTLLILDAKGGPLVVDGTGAGFTSEFSLVVSGSVQAASNLAVGVPSASARIHAAAGTAAPGTASLKIPSGILLGVTEPGAVESDSSHIYWTDSLGTRHQLDNSATPDLATVLAAGNTTGAYTISCSDGTAATPEITWTTDLACGFYHSGTGPTGSLFASVNGVQRLALNTSSLLLSVNEGINTTIPPVARLEVVEGSFTSTTSNATNPGSVKLIRTGASGPNATGGLELQSSTTSAGEGCKLYAESNTSTCGIAYRKNSALWTSKFCVSTTTGGVTIGDANPPPATVMLQVRTGQSISTPVAGQDWDGLRVADASLAIFSGAPLTITSLNMVKIGVATVNGTSAAVTVSDFYSQRIAAPTTVGSASFTRSYSLGVDGNVKLGGGQTVRGKNIDVGLSPYAVLQSDFALECRTTGGAISIALPAISVEGNGRLLVSIDSDYNAAANNITLVPNGGDKIDNVAGNYTQSTSGSAVWLKSNSTTLNWEIL